jgi:hypothetical protein
MRSRRQHLIRHPQRTPRIPRSYQILVGDSSRSLPLSGSVTVGSTITTGVLSPDGTGAGRRRGTSTVTVTGRTAAGVTTTATFVWTVS